MCKIMRIDVRAFLAVWVLLLFTVQSVHAGSTVYKSIGPDGSIVYSDHPPADGRVEKTFDFADLPSTSVPDSQPVEVAPKRGTQKSLPMAPGGTTLFSATWCGYCKLAKAYLQRNGVSYRNIDIDAVDGRAMFISAGGRGIPLLFVGNRAIRGFTPDGYKRFLGGS